MADWSDSLLADWNLRVEGYFQHIAESYELTDHVLSRPDDRTTEVTGVDWGGFPIRVARCLTRQQALEVLDWRGDRGDEGRRQLQEEYLEWRTVRDDSGAITRVEMTTELPDYWRCLAAWEPARTLELVAEFAREATVSAGAVYGRLDPFAAGISPKDRERAFAATMLAPDGDSAYNDGRNAICCMVNASNTLESLVELVTRSAAPYTAEDASSSGFRSATAAEIIPELGDAAQAGRNSDPVIVERLARLAFEGRLVALDDPVGVYIQAAEHTRLRSPDGSQVPSEWFVLGRGAGPEVARDRRGLYQRLVFEVPKDEGFQISDLVDVATEQPIRCGGQIADLIRLAVFVRTSGPNVLPVEPRRLSHAEARPDTGCAQIRDSHDQFQHLQARAAETR